MPVQESADSLQQLCNSADPNSIYRDMIKIGEGAAGEVPFFRLLLIFVDFGSG
jgi:hypothetical protein